MLNPELQTFINQVKPPLSNDELKKFIINPFEFFKMRRGNKLSRHQQRVLMRIMTGSPPHT